jgi:hypothetical protein
MYENPGEFSEEVVKITHIDLDLEYRSFLVTASSFSIRTVTTNISLTFLVDLLLRICAAAHAGDPQRGDQATYLIQFSL